MDPRVRRAAHRRPRSPPGGLRAAPPCARERGDRRARRARGRRVRTPVHRSARLPAPHGRLRGVWPAGCSEPRLDSRGRRGRRSAVQLVRRQEPRRAGARGPSRARAVPAAHDGLGRGRGCDAGRGRALATRPAGASCDGAHGSAAAQHTLREGGGGADAMTMDAIVSLCKRRGIIFQSSEIYGGTGSCWDYGPLGVELKNNVKRAWWRDNVQLRPDMVGLDASILMHAPVWKASGDLDHFTDPMVDCKECRRRFRADKIDEQPWIHYCPATKGNKFEVPAAEPCKHCGARRTLCPECGKGELTAPRQFNLMFKTFMGPVEEDAAVTYLRPETAQGIFVNFDNVLQAMRLKLTFGIAQIGKAFRNEITPGNFIFRTREFEQMEIEYFVNP